MRVPRPVAAAVAAAVGQKRKHPAASGLFGVFRCAEDVFFGIQRADMLEVKPLIWPPVLCRVSQVLRGFVLVVVSSPISLQSSLQ